MQLFIILIIPFIIFLIWFVLIYIRKSLWDTVHRNLLDLEDKLGGSVIRNNFLARPVFHGKINGTQLTINFSSEKINKNRVNYIDITYANSGKFSFTLSKKEWLKEQNAGPQEDYSTIKNSYGNLFIIRPISDENVKKLLGNHILQEFIDTFFDLAYLFMGKTGIICEFSSEHLASATEYQNLIKRVELLDKLSKAIT